MPENALTRALAAKEAHTERKWDAWVEGKFIYYIPTFELLEVKEWWGRYDKKRSAYRLPRLTLIARKIRQHDPAARLTPDVEKLLDEWERRDHAAAKVITPAAPYDHLRDFQKQAFEALVTRPYHGCLLTLSPGLGKTPTSIVAADAWVNEFGESKRILVVSPWASGALPRNFIREITGTQHRNPFQWSIDPRVELCHQTEPAPNQSVRWTVTNYDSLIERGDRGRATQELKEEWDLDWDLVIFDESVLLKNRKTTRGIVANKLAKRARRVWLLSGSPVTRDYSDIWNQFHCIEEAYFGSFWSFAKEYCVVIKTPWSDFNIMGSRHDRDLRTDFPELMFVRNQEEVFDELPEYIYKDYPLPLTKLQKKAHDDILSEWLHTLEMNADRYVEMSAFIAVLSRLMQVTSNLFNLQTVGRGDWPDSSAKADLVQEIIDLEEEWEYPILIWVHHRPGAHALRDRLQAMSENKKSAFYGRRVELVLGKTKGADGIIEEFKDGDVDVLLLGKTVGKYGHTLANAKTVVAFDRIWDSDAEFQALHRVAGARALLAGYTHRPILAILRAPGTIDDFVELNLAGKLPSMANVTGADLAKILRSLGEEHVR
jgi:hypothetical protein